MKPGWRRGALVRACALLTLAAGLALAPVTPGAAATTVTAGFVDPMVTVQPLDTTAGTASAALRAMPGEIESVQVVLRGAGGQQASGVSVSVGALTGPGGALIGGAGSNDVTVFREEYTRIWTPSDAETWCRYFANDTSTYCGVPVDGNAENTTWKCGNGVDPALDVRRCLVPDALVPERDAFYREDRTAFPLTVPAGENRTAWIDVAVPAAAAPGTYTGSVTVRASGSDAVDLPVTVEVGSVALPAPGSDTAVDLGGGVNVNPNLCSAGAHACAGSDAEVYRLMSLYTRASLENRMPILNPASTLTPDTATRRSLFDTWLQPLVAGTPTNDPAGLLTPSRQPGSRVPLVLYNQHTSAADWRAWQLVARDRGFEGRMRFYCDELYTKADFEAGCANPYAAATNAANGGWRNAEKPLRSVLIGTQANEDDARTWEQQRGTPYAVLTNEATRVPIANYLDPKGDGAGQLSTRGQYDAAGGFLAGHPDRSLWMYTSNMSVGGGNGWTPHKLWTGWPVLSGVDQTPVSEAAGPVTAWMYDVTGHYYYDAFQRLGKAWNDCAASPSACLYNEGGHGDGTLYYPGITDRIGGTHPIPVESIRLKRYRDGAETYTLLRMLQQGCDGACDARSRATLAAVVGNPATGAGLFAQMSATDVPAPAWHAARSELLDMLPAGAAPIPAPTLSMADDQVVEGSDGQFNELHFVVSRTGDLDRTSSAQVTWRDGTATFNGDYSPLDTSVTFAPGEASKVVAFDVLSDTTPEADETLVAGLAAPQGATVDDAEAIGTILDDDTVAPVTYRPDESLRRLPSGAWRGVGTYGTTGTNQALGLTLDRGQTVTVAVRMANAGTGDDSFSGVGTESGSGTRITYLAGTTDVSADMRSGSWSTGVLAPGTNRVVKVRLFVPRAAAHGAVRTVLVHQVSYRAKQEQGLYVRDTVKITVTVR